MKTNCNTIKELLPSYIDKSCSDETAKEIQKHLRKCRECRSTYYSMTGDDLNLSNDKKKIDKRRKVIRIVAWSCFGVFVAGCALGIGALKLMGEGKFYIMRDSIFDFFYPKEPGIVRITDNTDEWHKVNFSKEEINDNKVVEVSYDYFEYNTFLVNKELTNHANSSGAVEIRIIDENGNVVIAPTTVQNGTSISLDTLELNTKYTVECRNGSGDYMINLT